MSSSAVHTKKPEMVWAVEVMRKMGSVGITRRVAGTGEEVGLPRGAMVGAPGTGPTGGPWLDWPVRAMSRRQRRLICEEAREELEGSVQYSETI